MVLWKSSKVCLVWSKHDKGNIPERHWKQARNLNRSVDWETKMKINAPEDGNQGVVSMVPGKN